MNTLVDHLASEEFKSLIDAAIRLRGEVTREELLDATFRAMETVISALVDEGVVELVESPHKLSHLAVLRASTVKVAQFG